MELQIDLRNATRTSIKATVRKDPDLSVSRNSIRTIILNMAAHAMGKETKDLLAPTGPLLKDGLGYDLRDGWTVEAETIDGFRVVTYTVTPLSGFDRAERLHKEGGTTPAQGGGSNYWLPGEFPKPTRTTVTVRQQGEPYRPQAKPAKDAAGRMARPRLK